MRAPRSGPDPSNEDLTVALTGVSTDASRSADSATRLRWLASIVECSDDAIIAGNIEGTITFWNPGAERLYGWTAEEAVGQDIELIVPASERTAIQHMARSLQEGASLAQFDAVRRHRDGHSVPVSLVVSALRDSEERVVGFTATARDMTEQLRVKEALAASEARFRALVHHSADVAFILDIDGNICHVPETAESIGRHSRGGLDNANAWELLHPDDRAHTHAVFAEVLASPGEHRIVELRASRGDGAWRWVEAVGTNLLHEPAVNGIVVNMRDITRRKEAEAELYRRAHHDELTGLPNRAYVLDRIRRVTQAGGEPAALLLLDIDEFKLVNDTHGHAVGDRLLQLVSARVCDAVRAEDIVARLGGDEFVVLCLGISDTADAVAVAEQIQAAFQPPFELAPGISYFVNATIGIAGGGPGHDPGRLLADADTAMYAAKKRERGSHGVYDETLRLASAARLRIEAELRAAVTNGELRCHYQPIVDIATGAPVGVEALARWAHPTLGMLAPAEWVPIAETSTLINSVGRNLLEQACRDASAWIAAGQGVPVAVNLSPRQLVDDAFPEHVAQLLHLYELPPGLLSFEVTEHAVLADPVRAVGIISRLRDLGVRFALDDFGTGYSSLAYLKQLPVELVKIDRSFIQGVARDWSDRGIVQAVVQLGRMLGRTVVAEGVERDDQWDVLRSIGCQLGQGFRWSPAVPADELGAVLDRLRADVGGQVRVSHS